MPKRTTRTIALSRTRRTVLRVTELERRDTPAWWSVAAPVPAEGVAGTTDATHSGEVTLRPELPATNGVATVWADTAAAALSKALVGTLTVTLLGESVEYAFGPDTVGAAVADHKAFLAVATGSNVSLGFEDMAGQAGCDYDYNDRTWSGVSVTPTGNPVLFEGDFTWTGTTGDATVHERVEALSEAVYKWDYFVRNDSFQSSFSTGLGVGAAGIGRVYLPSLSKEFVLDSYSSRGGVTLFSQPAGPGEGEVVFSFGTSQYDGILPGENAEFWLTTAPRPLAPRSGLGTDSGFLWRTAGPVMGPDALPAPTVTLTTPTTVLVNANNDNGSAWLSVTQKYIPAKRDFNVGTPTTYVDPELRPATVVITGGMAGILVINEYSPGTSTLSFWKDGKKTKGVTTVQIPSVLGVNPSYTFNFMVEGTHESAYDGDVSRVTATFTSAGGTANDVKNVSVAPIMELLSVNTTNVRFTNGNDGRQGLEAGNLNAGLPGITFNATVANYGLPFFFINNLTGVKNAFNKSNAGAVNTNPALNKNLKGTNGVVLPTTLLDSPDATNPALASTVFPVAGDPNSQSITSNDSPILPNILGQGTTTNTYDVSETFVAYLTVLFPRDKSIYTIGKIEWNVNFFATRSVNAAGAWADTIDASSKITVTSSGHSNDDPANTSGSIANGNITWQ